VQHRGRWRPRPQVGHAATRLELLHAFRPLATALGALASLTILLNLALPGLRMM
jgi:hypothetical protein